MRSWPWRRWELIVILIYVAVFYTILIRRSLHLSRDHSRSLRGLREGWIGDRLNDISDAQWRNFRGNLPILTLVMGIFTSVASILRWQYRLNGRGMSLIWLLLSMIYLVHLHGACVVFILVITSVNFSLVKIFVQSRYYLCLLWIFNLAVLFLNRIYEGYTFASFGEKWAFLDSYRGTFRWHICFNFVVLRMISFGCDYHWSKKDSLFDQKKHMQLCRTCSPGKTCYMMLQERGASADKYSYQMYLCYLVYAPLYIAGPVASFNAFAAQLDMPSKVHSLGQVTLYGFRWILGLLLMEAMTHFFYYNAFAISGLWKQLSPFEIFIIGYGVLNFMWLKFFLIWRYFRFWSLIGGIETPENMPRCMNNCYNLETFWKSWHASFNKWLVRYLYIPLGGSRTKLLNMWVIFTFVAVWHDLEWKLLSWAWLTCIFFIPEVVIKSILHKFQATSTLGTFVTRELSAVGGAITIGCLMVANLVGYVIGPSGINWLLTRLFQKDGLPVLSGILISFYLGTKLMFHIRDAKLNRQ